MGITVDWCGVTCSLLEENMLKVHLGFVERRYGF